MYVTANLNAVTWQPTASDCVNRKVILYLFFINMQAGNSKYSNYFYFN